MKMKIINLYNANGLWVAEVQTASGERLMGNGWTSQEALESAANAEPEPA